MKSGILAAAIVMAVTGVSAFAQQAEQEAEKPEKKVCRTEKATGSLTRRTRICLTQAQWREVNSRTYKGVSEMQGEASGGQVSSFEGRPPGS